MSDEDAELGAQDGGAKAAAPSSCPVVGIGASAGGIEAFKAFLAHTPPDTGAAFVLILHLAPDRESILAEIMGQATAMRVVQAEEGMRVEPNRVYVIPPGAGLTMGGGRLHVSRNTPNAGRANPIDLFLLSLAESHGPNAACVILSGAGQDGTIGLRAIKEHGGLTIAQSAETAAHDSMLRSAVDTGLVDFQLRVEEIPARLQQYFHHVNGVHRGEAQREPTPDQLRRICARVQAVTGHDFGDYKDRTLIRRIQRRMNVHHLARADQYLKVLNQGRREADLLLKDLLIGVTHFFRDPEAFEVLAREVAPRIVKGKGADEQIRVWVAGCATGEEAYSIAIVLQEALDASESPPKVAIFASDLGEEALQFARIGRYPSTIERDVSRERLERFFIHEDGTFRVRRRLREMCVFASHNLLRDPPFSRMHLISCRNLLIYLSANVQERLLPVLHYALQPGGFLFLGSSESVGRHTRLFDPINKKHRIYVRRKDGVPHPPRFPVSDVRRGPAAQAPTRRYQDAEPAADTLARRAEAVLGKYSPAYVIINDHFDIVRSSRRTGRFLELGGGPPELNLLSMARPELRFTLRAAVQEAGKTGAKIVHNDVQVSLDGASQRVNLFVEPLGVEGQTCFVVVFQEVGAPRPAAQALPDQADRPIGQETVAQLEAELHDARETLQSTTEELETSNEELRSANEELSSVNEELQSANEELETSKEELQSVNEELQTINYELNSRVEDLSRANNYLKNLLENIQLPMVFLNNDLMIRNFTPRAVELFRLRESDAGRPITEITSALDYARLMDDIAEVRRTEGTVEREIEAEGRTYSMRVLPYRTTEDVVDGIILTFTDVTEHRRSEEHQKMLVAELSHRVKNMLATVQAIAAPTVRSARSMEEFKATFSSRIAALSSAHALLTTTDWHGARLHAVLREPLKAYQSNDGDRIPIRGEDFGVRPKVALTLSLVINELATNAAKYGALSTSSGRIDLTTGMTRTDLGEAVSLVWQERGGPEITARPESGYGLDLIERAVGYELDSEGRFEFLPEGLRCEIVMPYNSENFQV